MELVYNITASRGVKYNLRYRVLNYIGWSDYSNILYALAATNPSKSVPPSLIQATATTITLGF
jgi:hypothetical protein